MNIKATHTLLLGLDSNRNHKRHDDVRLVVSRLEEHWELMNSSLVDRYLLKSEIPASSGTFGHFTHGGRRPRNTSNHSARVSTTCHPLRDMLMRRLTNDLGQHHQKETVSARSTSI